MNPNAILQGVELLFTPMPMTFLVIGVLAGFLVGVLPGFDSANAAALALAFSVSLAPEVALLLMIGIYAGAGFAGAVPAILLNVPGTAGAAATALDGHPMAMSGRGAEAIGIARMASTLGGVLASVATVLIIGPMAGIALLFRSPEMALVALMGLVVIGGVIGGSPLRGLLAAFLGLLVSMMSASSITAEPRFMMGYLELYEEVPFIPVAIGLFALTEMLILAHLHQPAVARIEPLERNTGRYDSDSKSSATRDAVKGIGSTLRHPVVVVRSSVIGLVIGAVPGMGTSVSNFISYSIAKGRSKKPERFGKGSAEGIIASEAADNGVAAGTLIPTLTLGVPGSSVAAVMLAAMILHGMQPGPQLMEVHPDISYAILLGVLLASILILPFGILLSAPLVRLARAPSEALIPIVMVIATVGAFASTGLMFFVAFAAVFGLIGFLMRLADVPVVPFVLGLILGPLAEANGVRSLLVSQGDWSVFFGTPITWAMWTVILVLLLGLTRQAWRSSSSATKANAQQTPNALDDTNALRHGGPRSDN